VGLFSAASAVSLMRSGAARVGSAASTSSLAIKRQHGQFTFRRRFAENFFIIVPAMLSDSSRTSDVKPFRFRNFQPRNDYLDALVRDCNFHDTTRRTFATQPRASARALLQFQ